MVFLKFRPKVSLVLWKQFVERTRRNSVLNLQCNLYIYACFVLLKAATAFYICKFNSLAILVCMQEQTNKMNLQ